MKTILITGCSSGFGYETAQLFLQRGWKVIATMRSPRPDLFPNSQQVRVLPLDVTKPGSIKELMESVGPIDALVNNAGVGSLNALEGMNAETIQEIFQTNTLGTIAMTQAVIPSFRERRTGVIVNVTSSVTLKSLPLLSVYTASKAAVNAFTQSVALELAHFNVRVRVVLPGRAPETKFAENAKSRMSGFPEAYKEIVENVFQGWAKSTEAYTHAHDVAEAVWKAVTDDSTPMFIPAGADAVEWASNK
ncbi:MAG: SDR family oxidoreductase [Bdellovibrionota bacterium]